MEKRLSNKQIEIAINHLELARKEITECANGVYKALETLEKDFTTNEEILDTITHAMVLLQMQDIVTQRLEKLKDFFLRIDAKIDLPEDSEYLKDFAWENEVDQTDVDTLFNQNKG